MVRRTPRNPFRRQAERTFPFRADIATPPNGLGTAIRAMAAWCEEAFGRDRERWQDYGAGSNLGGDKWRFYFRDRADRDRFMAEGVPAGLTATAENKPEL